MSSVGTLSNSLACFLLLRTTNTSAFLMENPQMFSGLLSKVSTFVCSQDCLRVVVNALFLKMWPYEATETHRLCSVYCLKRERMPAGTCTCLESVGWKQPVQASRKISCLPLTPPKKRQENEVLQKLHYRLKRHFFCALRHSLALG